jgi:competence protein ComEC
LLQKALTHLQNIFLLEKDNWILWIPVFFCIGISFYFSLQTEPSAIRSCIVLLLLVFALYCAHGKHAIFFPLLILATIASGFLAANIRTLVVQAPILEKSTGVKKISGIVTQIEVMPHGKRFLIENPKIEKLAPELTPAKIRVMINTDDGDATPGDDISMLASLTPPPEATIPGGYNFARYAFFAGIGAVGYSISDVEIIQKSTSLFQNSIAKVRRIIVDNILAATDKKEGNIAAALLVGEQGGIDKQTIINWRISGIAHILSISGLHLSLAAAIFFFASRAIFALIPGFALKYDIKKWSAFLAIFSSFIYLLLSGSPVPAQRSFIMTSLILIAIIIDRTGTPMRSIALAAMLILIFLPESALDPSFQMSFSSVIALISCYSLVSRFIKEPDEHGLIQRFFLYFLSIAASSLIAGIATAPFTIYHFNNFSSYGILTNLISIPITSFIVMPAGVVALLLMPIGLEKLGLIPMSWGIKMISKVAEYIANLPQAIDTLPPLPELSFCLIVFGGLWFCLWTTSLRLYAAIPILLGIIAAFFITIPDIIIDGSGNLFVVKAENNRMVFSSEKTEKYARDSWDKKFSQNNITDKNQDDNKYIKCDALGCIYSIGTHKAVFSKHPIVLEKDCMDAQILINLTHFPSYCKNAVKINLYDLKKSGTHVVYFENDGVRVTSVRQEEGDRPWN